MRSEIAPLSSANRSQAASAVEDYAIPPGIPRLGTQEEFATITVNGDLDQEIDECLVVSFQSKRLFFTGPVDLLFALRESDDREILDLESVQRCHGSIQLSTASIDQKEIG